MTLSVKGLQGKYGANKAVERRYFMTYGEIKNADYEEIAKRKAEREKDVFDTLNNLLSGNEYEVSNIEINFQKYEEAGCIEYHFKLSDGFEQTDSYYWEWNESVESAVEKIKEHIDYIVELRNQYPQYAKNNDYIQSHKDYKRICKITDRGYEREAILTAELCGYLKLPNTTNCSVGGGDYEIKKTPKRVEDFNKNIDTLCLFLADCIGELRAMKLKWRDDE